MAYVRTCSKKVQKKNKKILLTLFHSTQQTSCPLQRSLRSTHLLIQATQWLEYVSFTAPPVFDLYVGTHHQEHCTSLTSIESRNSKIPKYQNLNSIIKFIICTCTYSYHSLVLFKLSSFNNCTISLPVLSTLNFLVRCTVLNIFILFIFVSILTFSAGYNCIIL